jgi:hypothetical protein
VGCIFDSVGLIITREIPTLCGFNGVLVRSWWIDLSGSSCRHLESVKASTVSALSAFVISRGRRE